MKTSILPPALAAQNSSRAYENLGLAHVEPCRQVSVHRRSAVALSVLFALVVGCAGSKGGSVADAGTTPGDDGGNTDGGGTGESDGSTPPGGSTDGGTPSVANGTPRIIQTTFPTPDVVIASWVVTDPPYSADASGAKDVSGVLQKALADCTKGGGGTVFLPAGRYRLDKGLVLPEGCSLRGDWKQPTDTDKRVEGTILLAYAGKNAVNDPPLLQIAGGAGVEYLSVFYPEQMVPGVIPYPATVRTAGKDVDPSLVQIHARQTLNVHHVNFVNSYFGVRFAYAGTDTLPPSDGLSIAFPLVQHVYGTPLNTGVRIEKASAFPRVQGVSFSPSYWAESGLTGAPAVADVRAYTQAHGVGVELFGNGAGDVTDAVIADYGTGVLYDDQTPGGSNGKLTGAVITGAHIGVSVGVYAADVFIMGTRIEATAGNSPAAIAVTSDAGTGTVFVADCSLSSSGEALVNDASGFNVNVMRTKFEAYSGHAVDSTAGLVTIVGSTFASSGHAAHLQLGANVTQAVLRANDFGGAPSIDNKAAASVVKLDATSYPLATPHIPDFSKLPAFPRPARTTPHDLYVVGKAPYAASSLGDTDATAAIQHALDDAGKNGGGTVYLPGGMYLIKGHLHVPVGVELRGVHDQSFYTTNARTALLAAADEGNAKGDPLITLDATGTHGAGIRGLLIWYPAQTTPYVKFPYAIRAGGQGCWAVDVVIPNGWDGLDFATNNSTGHYIEGIAGIAVDNFLKVSKSTGGFIRNLQTNPTFWKRVDGGAMLKLPGTAPDPNSIVVGGAYSLWDQGSAITLGSAQNELILGAFTHGPRYGVLAQMLDGGAPSATLVSVGAEIDTFLRIEALDPAGMQVINATWHTMKSTDKNNPVPGQPYVIVTSDVPADRPLQIFSAMNWVDTSVGYDISGGNVLLQQYQTRLSAGTFVKATGGKFSLVGGRFEDVVQTHAAQSSSGKISFDATLLTGSLSTTGNVSTTDVY